MLVLVVPPMNDIADMPNPGASSTGPRRPPSYRVGRCRREVADAGQRTPVDAAERAQEPGPEPGQPAGPFEGPVDAPDPHSGELTGEVGRRQPHDSGSDDVCYPLLVLRTGPLGPRDACFPLSVLRTGPLGPRNPAEAVAGDRDVERGGVAPGVEAGAVVQVLGALEAELLAVLLHELHRVAHVPGVDVGGVLLHQAEGPVRYPQPLR